MKTRGQRGIDIIGSCVLAIALYLIVAPAIYAQVHTPFAHETSMPMPHGTIPPVLYDDLRCSITMSFDSAGKQLIQNGETVMTHSGPYDYFVHVTVQNRGPFKAENFRVDVQEKTEQQYSGGHTDTMPYTTYMTVPSDSSSEFDPPPIQVGLQLPVAGEGDGPYYEQVTITATVDVTNKIPESDEYNNTCTFQFLVKQYRGY
jgi:hypothetical protein